MEIFAKKVIVRRTIKGNVDTILLIKLNKGAIIAPVEEDIDPAETELIEGLLTETELVKQGFSGARDYRGPQGEIHVTGSGYLDLKKPLFFEDVSLFKGFEKINPPYGGKIVRRVVNAIKGVINKITPFEENREEILKDDLLYEVHPLIKVANRGKIHYPSLNKSNFSLVDLPGELKTIFRFGEWEKKLPKTGKVEVYNTEGAVEIVGVGAAGEAWRVLFEENEAQGRAIVIIKEEIVWVYDRYKNKYHKPRLYVLKEKKLYSTELFRSLGNIVFLSDEDRIPIEKEEVKDLSKYGIVKVGEEEYYSQDYGLVWAPPQYKAFLLKER